MIAPAVVEPRAAVATLPPEAMPDVEHLITEDDTPVDNIFSEKQMRLLTEPLYSSWAGPGEGRPFLALANVGLFYAVRQPPLVPDVMLSLDVQAPADLWPKPNRSYFVWEYGKAPDVVIEIVSNAEDGKNDRQMRGCARIVVSYYVIFDPTNILRRGALRVFELLPSREYIERATPQLAGVKLGLCLWRGVYEGLEAEWLRWCELDGNLIPTGAERAERERARAERERAHAERARARVERLAAQLRALGVEPELES